MLANVVTWFIQMLGFAETRREENKNKTHRNMIED